MMSCTPRPETSGWPNWFGVCAARMRACRSRKYTLECSTSCTAVSSIRATRSALTAGADVPPVSRRSITNVAGSAATQSK